MPTEESNLGYVLAAVLGAALLGGVRIAGRLTPFLIGLVQRLLPKRDSDSPPAGDTGDNVQEVKRGLDALTNRVTRLETESASLKAQVAASNQRQETWYETIKSLIETGDERNELRLTALTEKVNAGAERTGMLADSVGQLNSWFKRFVQDAREGVPRETRSPPSGSPLPRTRENPE